FTRMKSFPNGYEVSSGVSLIGTNGIQVGPGDHWVTLPKQQIEGDFYMECEYKLIGAYTKFRVRLEGPDGKPVAMEVYGGSGYGNTITLMTQVKTPVATPADKNRFRLERLGSTYKLSLNGQELLAGEGPKGTLTSVRLNLLHEPEGVQMNVYNFKIAPLKLSPI